MGDHPTLPHVDVHEKPDAAHRQAVVAALRHRLPARCVAHAEEEPRPYESDGRTAYREMPMAVVLPETRSTSARP